ncbi:MAG: AsmA-like C-terminal region-containing protein [Bacteroidota bacterium]|nr:AsmA-like C-terminal region-containing protein [Bacteroidota bacterium]
MLKNTILYKTLKWTTGLLLLAVIATWLILSVFREDIQQGIISSLEEEYGIEVDYSQTALILWKSFPNLSLRVEDFVVGYSDSSRPAMVDVSGFYASVSLPSLISGRYSIKEILLENGRVNVNLEDLSGAEGNQPLKAGTLELDLMKMRDIHLKIGSLDQAQMLSLHLRDAVLKISGKTENLKIELLAEALPHFALPHLENILGGEAHEIRLKANFNTGSKNLSIENGALNISGNEFRLNVSLEEETYSIVLDCRQARITRLRSLFTEYLQDFEQEVELNGKMKTRIAFTAKYSDHVPEIVVDFTLSEAQLGLLQSGLQFSIDELHAQFQNHASDKLSDFELNIAGFKLHNEFMNMNGMGLLRNFDAPLIELDMQSEILLNKLPPSIADSLTFDIARGDLFLKTRWERKRPGWEALRPQDLVFSRMQSKFELQDLVIKGAGEEELMMLSKAYGSFNNNDLMIDSMLFHKGRNKIALRVSFQRFFSFLLMPREGEAYYAEVHVNAGKVYPDDLLVASPAGEPHALDLYPDFSVMAYVEADSISYRKFRAGNVRGLLSFKRNEWQADSLEFSAWQGKNEINARLKRMYGAYGFEAEIFLKSVDVRQMFYELDDFGQEAIGFRNVEGKLDASLHFEGMMDDGLHIVEDSIKAVAELSIIRGRLSDFEPLLSALSFLDEEDLRRIDFDTLKNSIEIRERKVFIPSMEIRSSLMDFEGFGTHGFDNQIDYHMRVLLSEVLSGRARDKKTSFNEYGYVEDDGLGRTSLFLKITGNAEDPEFDYDRKAVARKIKEDFIREKGNFAGALKNEFHWLSRDSLKKQEAEKRKDWIRKQEEGKFIFEWDADTNLNIEQK